MKRCLSLTLAFLLAGCSGLVPWQTEDRPPAKSKIIWQKDGSPVPLDAVRLTSGESKSVPLVGSAGEEILDIVDVDGPDFLELAPDEERNRITIKSMKGAGGSGLVRVTVKTILGEKTLAFPVVVKELPLTTFTYDPPEGKDVEQVNLAGDFNGWSSNADPFTETADGTFTLEKGISPGTWSYKFVVDGEWISDPSNPRTDSSGYGNSIITVEGEKVEELDFAVLNSDMPGSGPQGAFRAMLNRGERLVPDSIHLIVNNRLMDGSAYTADTESGTIRFEVPSSGWFSENYACVLAESSSGRSGVVSAFFTHKGAPRSPRDEIIYYTLTDRFRDGDPELNNPADDPRVGRLANYLGGDWAGIREKIDEGYFDELGVTTLWISPPNKNTPKVEQESIEPGRFFTSYHGYWPISSTETNEQFGTMEDLRGLVSAAHEHDVAVLLDFVVNHVHEDHPIYQRHPDWNTPLILPDGEKNIRLFDEHPLTTWFDTFLPTLNYKGNDRIHKIMQDNAVYWMEETGADGFRQDAVKHIPMEFWRGLTARLNEEFPDRLVYQVGETISGYDTVAKYVGADLMPGQFDFPGYFDMRDVIARGEAPMSNIAESFAKAKRYYPASTTMSPLIGNHDVTRFMAFADGDVPPGTDEKELGYEDPPVVDHESSYNKLRLAYAWLMTVPGAPMIYYGDEIGMTGAGDPDNRRPMIWRDWSEEQRATFDTVSALAKARHGSVALRRGAVQVLHAAEERVVYARVAPEEVVLVALTREPETGSITLVLPEYWGQPLSITPLVDGPSNALLEESRLRITDPAWGYGIWKLNW